MLTYVQLIQGSAWIFMVPVISSGIMQMNIATQCSTQAVSNVIDELKERPNSAELWIARVAKPTVALSTEVMPGLSRFGAPLMATFASFWSFAVAFFALAINPNIDELSRKLGLHFLPTTVYITFALFTAAVCAFIPVPTPGNVDVIYTYLNFP